MSQHKIQYFLFLFILILVQQTAFSQLSKTHYIPPITESGDNSSLPQDQYLYISTPSITPVTFTIKPVGATTTGYIIGTTSNSTPYVYSIGTGRNTQLFVNVSETSTLKNNKGYIIEAQDVIYVSARVNAGAQAGALVSKGLAALDTTFRVGNFTNENAGKDYLSFVSVMATEDNTTITFDDLATGLKITNYTGTFPVITTLNKGESYIVAINSYEATANRDGLIGALVTSTKPIVVNCGSANGSFHTSSTSRDYGIDQIVGLSKVGKEYIFVKGDGKNGWENVLIVAHSNNTQIFINGNTTAIKTINAGEYYSIEGDKYSSLGNMYVETSEAVFAYQGVGATTSEANQGMFFVPPLNCETRGDLDNIASIQSIGTTTYDGGITIVTKIGATVTINNSPIANFAPIGPNNVDGNPNYVTYKVTGLLNNISVKSTDELYCAYFNYNGAATSGSFYSGFPTAPEINYDTSFSTLGICIPNIKLQAANMSNFDSVEWFFNDGTGFISTGNTTTEHTPLLPGKYKLRGKLDCSGLTLDSSEIPISICPDDTDNDGIIDNIDVDNDNDGILNCTESFGDSPISLTNMNSGNLTNGSYNFIGTKTPIGNILNSIIGDNDGIFKSEVFGKNGLTESSVTYKIDFNKDLNLVVKLPTSNTLGGGNLIDEQEFIIQVPANKTITLLDPDDQLLVDINFDGIYESDITQYSSFEIHFKIKGTSLIPSTATFKFVASMINSFSYTHKNTSETTKNTAVFKIKATCLPIDTDNDGITDEFDYDSDNDGIPDIIENVGTFVTLSGVDADLNGVDDVFSSLTVNLDSDNDGVPNYYDLDSDNDGIYDLEESGSGLTDANFDGIIDNVLTTIGANGWDDTAETIPDSGIIKYIVLNTDSDALLNYTDADSDGDTCSDVIEAGFTDGNNDGFIDGTSTTINGTITGSDGYTTPNINYITAAPITIITQPSNQTACELNSTIFTIETNAIDSYQWEVSTDGINWSTIINNTIYTNATTNTLTISNIPLAYNNYKYRVLLNTTGNSCGLISNEVTLTVHPLPIVTALVTLKQCDDDTDGFSFFNLTEVNAKIYTNAANEPFTYYNSLGEANSGVGAILDPIAFQNKTINTDTVWARVESSFGCFQTSEIKLIVSTTGIPSTFKRTFNVCDDYVDAANDDRDGIATFNFSSVDAEVRTIFPIGQLLTIKYYRNEADALSESNEIADISNYRNIGYPTTQQIYIRVDSQLNNDCLGFGAHITLNVEALPYANTVTIANQCDDDQDGQFPFDTSFIESTVLNGQTGVTVSYVDKNNNPLPSPLPNPFLTGNQTIKIRVTNNTTLACFDETTLEFIVDAAPIAHPVVLAPVCDDETNDGIYNFDTSTIQSTILGSQTSMEVLYFDAAGSPLSSPLPNPFTTSSQTITVQVINPLNTTCIANSTIDFTVNPLPNFEVNPTAILCLTEPVSTVTLSVTQENTSENLNYTWENENRTTVLSTNKTFDVDLAGNYFITLTKTDGTNCARTKKITVSKSEKPTITYDNIVVVDDTNNNSIQIISLETLGLGDYEFSLNDPDYGFQDEPFFDNLPAQNYTLYVRDKNGCGTSQIEVSVIQYPNFFTPNGDGSNDTWNIIGLNNTMYPTAIINIFNRFGKLIYKMDPNGNGWDGFFNGTQQPSSDYWFSVELIDNKGRIKIKKGHFSLIRR